MTAMIAQETTTWNGSAAISEELLIQRGRAGDHDAFEVIFNRWQTPIYNYIYRLMGNATDAEDMTADVFLKAFVAIPRTSEDLKLRAWLYTIATNTCRDEVRHRKLIKWQAWSSFIRVFHPSQLARDFEEPEHQAQRDECTEAVQAVLALLPPRYRMVLILREYQDLQYSEIAEVLNTTRPAVKSLLFRARQEFAKHWRVAYA